MGTSPSLPAAVSAARAKGDAMTRFAAAIALVLAATSIAPLGSDAAATPSSPACSRERSRHARDVLDEFFHPVVARNDFVLPPNCPFGRDKDMYLEHERHKEVVRRTQYKSLYSDKVFKSEYYVDKHMDNRHMDKIPEGADTCLADYCDVLRCDEHREWKRSDGRGGVGLIAWATARRCDREKMRGVRHHCEMLMHRCFPSASRVDDDDDDERASSSSSSASAAVLREHFTRHHCEYLTCESAPHMFERLSGHVAGGRSGGYYVALGLVGSLLAAYYLGWAAWRGGGRRVVRDLKRARKETWRTTALSWVERARRAWPIRAVFGGKRRKRKAF